jgi:tripartite-type tricarboxylate transporter receptor subunit TctC
VKLRLIAAALALAIAPAALAQTAPFPSKPVRIMVGSAAGGGTDIVSRLLAQKLTELWGQQVIVENRTGASATIAADFVAKSAPDGYTVVMAVPNSHTIGPHVLTAIPYKALEDFAPITLAATVPQVLVVGNGVPANNVAELVSLAKEKPGTLNFSSSGNGSTQHLAGELFNLTFGTRNVHIPYKGSAAAMGDLVAGQVTMSLDTTASAMGQIKAGKLKALAVTTPKRSSALPDVPTMAELGYPQMEIYTWYGLFAPAKTPKAIVDKWQQDVAKVLAMPDVRERLGQIGAEPGGLTPEEFGAMIRSEYAKMGKLVRDANVRSE